MFHNSAKHPRVSQSPPKILELYPHNKSHNSSLIHYFLNLKMDDLVHLRNILKRNPDLRWGFVIYRCTYESDSDWAHFMDLLNTRVRLNLEEEGGLDLLDRLDWCVQDDRDVLDDASTSQVRT
jgi:hypothetical protein